MGVLGTKIGLVISHAHNEVCANTSNKIFFIYYRVFKNNANGNVNQVEPSWPVITYVYNSPHSLFKRPVWVFVSFATI